MAVPLTLQVKGKGRHRLDVMVRMKLVRQGGWSMVAGRLPAAPATALTLRIPRAGTEVRLSGVCDRRSYETTSPGETIETALRADGFIRIEWRPKIREGHVDPSLTATSEALFDVREDGLRLTWEVNLDFGRTERDAFTVTIPGGYLVQTVDGPNVRGWVTHTSEIVGSASSRSNPENVGPVSNRSSMTGDSQQDQELHVALLKPARQSGSVAIVLQRADWIGKDGHPSFDVPIIRVPGAVLHKGRLTIRRSPLLSLQTNRAAGVTRTDVPEDVIRLASLAGDGRESPLGCNVYQAYRFAATPFDVELTAMAIRSRPSAEVQTVLRIGERQRNLESRVNINAGAYPVYQVRVVIPDDLKIGHVSAPGPFEWSVTTQCDQKVLNVYLATGRQDRFSILIRGMLGEQKVIESLALPRLEVLSTERQQGDIVIEVDPAFDLQVADLKNCRETPLERTYGWLAVEQRPLSRLALRYGSPDYAGVLWLSQRKPIVTCSTVTNVRITDAAIEETILLDYIVERAGIRSISFLLPNWMKDSHITLPMLRQKTVEPVSDAPDAPIRVWLQLQDDVMGRLRVLVENDRLLTSQTHRAPVPTVETGRVERQFVTLESAGRDEVVIDEPAGLETLSHQQKEWRNLTYMLGNSITQAYIVKSEEPVLSFKTKERVAVETAGARIGLAETVLVADAHGAYRAAQSYRLDNRTEQFLDVELPKDAQLLSAVVAGDPVKPARLPGTTNPRRVRIPLIRTAAGDLDYVVVLKYGGRIPSPGGLRSVEFPLIRTVNVPVELSQVRLFLPETLRWLDFGGTMRRVLDEGDLAAGFVRYQTRLAQRLVRTMQSDRPFAQVRAAANLGELKSEMDQYRHAASTYAYNPNFQTEITSNEAVVRKAEEQIRQLTHRPRQPGTVEDNRARLNTFFEGQRISRARNLVQELPDNFGRPGLQDRQEQLGQQRFSGDWLDANRLSNVAVNGQEGVFAPEQFDPSIAALDTSVPAQAPVVLQQQRRAQVGARVGPASSRSSVGSAEHRDVRRGKKHRRVRRGGTDEAVAQYQQQLQKEHAAAPESHVGPAFSRSVLVVVEREESAMATDDGFAITRLDVGRIATGGLSGSTAGLASLAVEFPLRGVPFHFTTPRGEVAITARAVSNRFIETLRHIGLLVAVTAVGVALYMELRRRHLSWRESRTFSSLLIVLGFSGALIGVLPVLGLVLIVVGVVARLNLRRRERAAVSA